MTRIAYPIEDKDVRETDVLTFDFSRRLNALETLTVATITATVVTGTDPTPSALLSGGASVRGANAMQKITGGLVGTTYEITCVVSTTNGRVLTLVAIMNVVHL